MNAPFAAPRRTRIPVLALALVTVVGAFALGWFVGRLSAADEEDGAGAGSLPAGPVQLGAGDVAVPAKVSPEGISQVQWDSHIPVHLNQYSMQFQRVAQTFTPPDGAAVLISLEVFVGYSIGSRAQVHILEVPDRRDPASARVLRTVELDLFEAGRGAFYPLVMDPPIPLEGETTYGFLVEVDQRSDEVGIGLISNQDVYGGGEAWYFIRQVGANGELISNAHAWQYHHDDLTFRLRFAEAG